MNDDNDPNRSPRLRPDDDEPPKYLITTVEPGDGLARRSWTRVNGRLNDTQSKLEGMEERSSRRWERTAWTLVLLLGGLVGVLGKEVWTMTAEQTAELKHDVREIEKRIEQWRPKPLPVSYPTPAQPEGAQGGNPIGIVLVPVPLPTPDATPVRAPSDPSKPRVLNLAFTSLSETAEWNYPRELCGPPRPGDIAYYCAVLAEHNGLRDADHVLDTEIAKLTEPADVCWRILMVSRKGPPTCGILPTTLAAIH